MMEIIATLGNKDYLEKYIKAGASGIMFGSAFSLRFNYSLDELKMINEWCHERSVKSYISIDALTSENDRSLLYEYLEFINNINVDGIYFADLGIINAAKKMELTCELIYDPDTLIANSLDASFFNKLNLGVVIDRELSYDEVLKILSNNVANLDMQVFGHLKMSYSKRKFLTNYFNHENINYNPSGRRDIRLVEETRNYELPIIEDEYGTRIYTDYCLLMYKELANLKHLIKRGIIDDTFIDGQVVCEVIKDITRLNRDNAQFLELTLKEKYQDITFSNGYLDNKTTKTKEDDE